MAGMSVDGLVSGLDTTSLINQLMTAESQPQTALKNKASAAQADAAAYRAVNTRFDALRTAAAALTTDAAWQSTKATSSSPTVTATASATAAAGSVTFAVTELAATHAVYSSGTWPSTTTVLDAVNPVSITIADSDGDSPATTITVPAGKTLAEAVAAINASSTSGASAFAVNTGSGFRLQLTSKTSGADGAFTVSGDIGVNALTTGTDATLTVGGAGGYSVTSPTNTFTDLMPGTSFTVSEKGATSTVSVTGDPDAIAAKVQNMVDAANGLLKAISSYTDTGSSSAVLKGDSTLRGLADQVLSVISTGISGVAGATYGIQLTKSGGFVFDKVAFTAALKSDPAGTKDVFAKKTVTSVGIDGVAGTTDDVTAPVGFAASFEKLAKGASDSTTGTLTLIADSSDASARDLEDRVDEWDRRLAIRKDTLTRQFTAMETALSTLKNQGSWLSSQISSLPSWSKSN
jgi:flagellar capping protein FliD